MDPSARVGRGPWAAAPEPDPPCEPESPLDPERIAGNPTDGAAVNPGEQGNVTLAFLLSENTEAEKVSFAPAGGGPARASVSLGGKA